MNFDEVMSNIVRVFFEWLLKVVPPKVMMEDFFTIVPELLPRRDLFGIEDQVSDSRL